jgi:hypothetical protein
MVLLWAALMGTAAYPILRRVAPRVWSWRTRWAIKLPDVKQSGRAPGAPTAKTGGRPPGAATLLVREHLAKNPRSEPAKLAALVARTTGTKLEQARFIVRRELRNLDRSPAPDP